MIDTQNTTRIIYIGRLSLKKRVRIEKSVIFVLCSIFSIPIQIVSFRRHLQAVRKDTDTQIFVPFLMNDMLRVGLVYSK